MLLLPKASYRFRVISIKIPTLFFTEIENTILIFIWNHRRPQIARTILRKDKAGGIVNYNNYIIIIKMWDGHKNRYIDQWTRITSPKINTCICGQLIYS